MTPEELGSEERRIYDSLVEDIAKLGHMLMQANPEMPNFLRQIHGDLAQYPELCHILSDEQVAEVYAALLAETKTQISVKESKKGGKKGLLSDGKNVADFL